MFIFCRIVQMFIRCSKLDINMIFSSNCLYESEENPLRIPEFLCSFDITVMIISEKSCSHFFRCWHTSSVDEIFSARFCRYVKSRCGRDHKVWSKGPVECNAIFFFFLLRNGVSSGIFHAGRPRHAGNDFRKVHSHLSRLFTSTWNLRRTSSNHTAAIS